MDNWQEEFEENMMCFAGTRDTPSGAIAKTLERLPADVRDWALENLVWFNPPPCNGMASSLCFNEITINRHYDEFLSRHGGTFWLVRVIYIAPGLIEAPESKQQFVIAHEIAHHWLNHATAQRTEEGPEAEAHADRLVREWGFTEPRE